MFNDLVWSKSYGAVQYYSVFVIYSEMLRVSAK